MKRFLSLLFVLLLTAAFVGEAFAQRSFGRGGGFGGGRSSFGGGGRSGGFFGGGSSRSSGGFFGGGSSRSSGSFSRPSAPSYSGPRGSGSFGRSGGFGNSGRVNSSSINPSRGYGGYGGGSYGGNRTTIIYGGHPYYSSGGFWSGYALGTLGSPWTRWMPFHPGFYTYAPYYGDDGRYYEGGFSFTRFIIGIALIAFVIWLLVRLFGGGGGRNIRYTNYR